MSSDPSVRRDLLNTRLDRRTVLGGSAAAALALAGARNAGAAGLPLPRGAAVLAQDGSSIRIGTLGEAFSINPFQAQESESYWRSQMLFDAFVRPNPENYSPEPGLAASWDVEKLTFTFHIQPNAKFHDGTDVTADDVKFTIEGLLAPATGSLNAYRFASIAGAEALTGTAAGGTPAAGTPIGATPAAAGGSATGVSGIEVIDPKTLKITLAKPDSSFLYSCQFVYVVPKAQLQGQDLSRTSTAPFFQKPIGAGAYVFASLDNSTNEFKATANPNFWETGKPAIQNLTHTVIADAGTLANALQSGDIDGSVYADPTLKDQLDSLGTLDTILMPFGSPNGTVFNCRSSNAPFDNAEVRRAVAMAVNVEAYVNDSLLGLGQAGLGPIAQSSWAYDKTIQPIPHDPDGAKAIFQKYNMIGQTYSIIANQGNTLRADWSIRLQADLKALDITINFETPDYPTVVNRVVTTHDYQLDSGDFAGATGDPNDLYDQFHSGGANNVTGYSSPELDALLEQGRTTLDQEAAKPIWAQVQQILMRDVPMHWAWYRPFVQAVKKEYTGYTNTNLNEGIFATLPDMTEKASS